MADSTIGFDGAAFDRVPGMDGGGAGSAPILPRPDDQGGGLCAEDDDAFRAAVAAIRAELAPAGALESLLVDRLIRSAWRLHEVARAEAAGAPDDGLLRREAGAERSLFRALHALEARRDRRAAGAGSPAPAVPLAGSPPAAAGDDPADWRGRLVLDPNISETSPVVRGTWVTVGHVISLIMDGWTWPDLLSTHPELTEEDLRACLAYHVQEEAGGDPRA